MKLVTLGMVNAGSYLGIPCDHLLSLNYYFLARDISNQTLVRKGKGPLYSDPYNLQWGQTPKTMMAQILTSAQ